MASSSLFRCPPTPSECPSNTDYEDLESPRLHGAELRHAVARGEAPKWGCSDLGFRVVVDRLRLGV